MVYHSNSFSTTVTVPFTQFVTSTVVIAISSTSTITSQVTITSTSVVLVTISNVATATSVDKTVVISKRYIQTTPAPVPQLSIPEQPEGPLVKRQVQSVAPSTVRVTQTFFSTVVVTSTNIIGAVVTITNTNTIIETSTSTVRSKSYIVVCS